MGTIYGVEVQLPGERGRLVYHATRFTTGRRRRRRPAPGGGAL